MIRWGTFAQPWISQRYDVMAGLMTEPSKSLLSAPKLAEWANERAHWHGATVERFGMSTMRRRGHHLTAYFDDLKYIAD